MGTHPTARVHPLRMALANAYLILGPKGMVLVDAGAWPDQRAILRQIRRLSADLRLILITHAHLDHYGGAGALRRATGAPIAIHVADASAMSQGQTPIHSARGIGRLLKPFLPLANLVFGPEPTMPDLLLTDEQDLGVYLGCEARVLHTPGHTPGSICLLVSDQAGSAHPAHAFAGDLIMTTGKPHGQRSFACDWGQVHASLLALSRLEPQVIWPGHGRRTLTARELGHLAQDQSPRA